MSSLIVFCLYLVAATTALSCSKLSRRELLSSTVSGLTAGLVVNVAPPAIASSAADEMLQELITSRSKLQEIPDLLQAEEWDKVRTILKTPPVNKLWNLGDSQNTVLKLAKETGNIDLFEMKDEVAYNLQMCDQLTYDNVFVYFRKSILSRARFSKARKGFLVSFHHTSTFIFFRQNLDLAKSKSKNRFNLPKLLSRIWIRSLPIQATN